MYPSAKSIANKLSSFETPTAVMTVGIPGSGKSTVIQQVNDHLAWPVLRSDGIREELTGSESNLSRDSEVWEVIRQRAEAYIESDQSFIVDATHNTLYQREFDSRFYRFAGARAVVALHVDIPLDLCLERNALRERVVPPDVLRKMHSNLESNPVDATNGFDDVIKVSNY